MANGMGHLGHRGPRLGGSLASPFPGAGGRGLLALFGQSLMAQAFSLCDLLAGLIFASFLGLFSREMWSIVVYPCVLSTRGMVCGVFCARLSSGLWIGTVRPSFLRNTRRFRALYSSTMVLSAVSALLMVVSVSFYGLAWGIRGSDIPDMTAAVLTTMALAFLTATPFSAFVAFASFKRGLDPDIITYPVSSVASDIIVTSCYVVALLLVTTGPYGRVVAYVVGSSFLLASLVLAVRERGDPTFRRALRESLASSALVVAISGLTGTLLGEMSLAVGLRPEVAMAYPALMGGVGDVGSIVGSTATTKMWSGELDADLRAFLEHKREIGAAWLASFVMFLSYGLLSGLGNPASLPFLLVTFSLTNLMAVGLVIALALSAGVLTYRYGLDPDNFVIPVESSAADAITTLSLFLASKAVLAFWVR